MQDPENSATLDYVVYTFTSIESVSNIISVEGKPNKNIQILDKIPLAYA